MKISTSNLQDRDIRKLEPKNKQYKRVVGNPKELYIWVNVSGKKSFTLRYCGKFIKLKDFREGIYSVAEARKDAISLLKELEGGKNISDLKGNNFKYKFRNLLDLFLQQQMQKCTADYVNKMRRAFENYILPKFGEIDVKNIKSSELLEVLNPLFRPNNISASRLELIDRLINYMRKVFEIAIDDDYITKNPAKNLKQYFPSKHNFYISNDYDPRKKGITDEVEIAEWLKDFNANSKISDEVRRMILFQILSANRPENTVKIKWEWIDFENEILTYPAIEMKMRVRHSVALSSYLLKILQIQKLYTGNSEYVFPVTDSQTIALSTGELQKRFNSRRDNLNKAMKNMGSRDKWSGKLTAHGFRKTFKTICCIHLTEIAKFGATNETVEDCMAHKQSNKIEYAYQMQRATIEQKRALLQWYGDYLYSLEPFEI